MGMVSCLDFISVDMEKYAVNLGLSRITENGHIHSEVALLM